MNAIAFQVQILDALLVTEDKESIIISNRNQKWETLMEKNLKTGGKKGLVTPSTALLNQRLATFSKPRMLTEYEIKLLRQSKVEIAEAIREMDMAKQGEAYLIKIRMIDTILSQLKMIEESHQVRILYALESGSRAWGFASLDSDYDVRFLYVHPVEWYLSIRDQRDVIEIPITDSLDINGWDLKKALKLFCKSNPPLLEWLRSPIVYRDVEGLAESLRNLIPTCFSPKNGMYHYLHMAKGNFREYLQGESVWTKKYFYVLRPVLACEWIARYGAVPPPVEFRKLVNGLDLDAAVIHEIDILLQKKIAGDELDNGPKNHILHQFLENSLTHLDNCLNGLQTTEPDLGILDELFRRMVYAAWGQS